MVKKHLMGGLRPKYQKAAHLLRFGRADLPAEEKRTTFLGIGQLAKVLKLSQNQVIYLLKLEENRLQRLAQPQQGLLIDKFESAAPELLGLDDSLLEQRLLTRWATLTLNQRVTILRFKGYKVNYQSLRQFYLANKVTFKVVKERRRWRRSDDHRNLLKDSNYLRVLQRAVTNSTDPSVELVFCDETIFSGKYMQKKAWAAKGQNVTPLVMLHSEPCIAAVIAISARKGMIAYGIRPKSFKAVDFVEWLTYLRGRVSRKYLWIILDQCPIHKAGVVTTYAENNFIVLIYTPAYHCWLQASELAFSSMKHWYRKRMLNLKLGGAKGKIKEEVQAAIKGFNKESAKRVCRFTQHLITRAQNDGVRMC